MTDSQAGLNQATGMGGKQIPASQYADNAPVVFLGPDCVAHCLRPLNCAQDNLSKPSLVNKTSAVIPRVVLDTNVCLDAFVFNDAHAQTLLRTLQRGAVHALIDQTCRDEWLRVIAYPQFALDIDRQRYATEQLDQYLRWLPVEGRVTRDIVLPLCKDTDDQKFLELALAAQAQWLITKDKELLKLGRRTLRDAGFAILTLKEWDARFTLV